jgi:hypothetical protein
MEHGGGRQAEEKERQVNDLGQIEVSNFPFRMASADRVSKLPVVEETVKMVNSLYGKVRVSNNLVNRSDVNCERNIILIDSTLYTFICSLVNLNRMLDKNLFLLLYDIDVLCKFTYAHLTYFASFTLNI